MIADNNFDLFMPIVAKFHLVSYVENTEKNHEHFAFAQSNAMGIAKL